MKIAIIGYGKMGVEIERLARSRSIEITTIIDNENDWEEKQDKVQQADVALEFSIPETAFKNISACLESGVPVVSGTTGWLSQYSEACRLCREKDGTFLYASNFNPGMNIFFHLNAKLAKIMDQYGQYDLRIEETHHIHKLDKPSGTAIKLAEDIIREIRRKNSWVSGKASMPGELEVTSIREGEVPGTHLINYSCESDEIEFIHKAKNRKGFAAGAIMAAEWVKDKKGIYTFNDVMKL